MNAMPVHLSDGQGVGLTFSPLVLVLQAGPPGDDIPQDSQSS
jgi:hypothetical protein